MRDALIAGITLNIFNKHCDRVKMAALAQMVNVLQSVILTEGAEMIKTPTYHVMHMYRHHQGADLLESALSGVKTVGPDKWSVPQLTESVSVNEQGVITITINNLSLDQAEDVKISLVEKGYRVVEAYVVTGDKRDAHNTFDAPDNVCEKDFRDYEVNEDHIVLHMPVNAVVELRIARYGA